VLESTRAREDAVRRETAEGLDHFRKQQQQAERAAFAEPDDASPEAEDEVWAAKGKKRKKSHGKESLLGVKLRKTSSIAEDASMKKLDDPKSKTSTAASQLPSKSVDLPETSKNPPQPVSTTAKASKAPPPPQTGPGLLAYPSSEDED
jgi:hypothetical protein